MGSKWIHWCPEGCGRSVYYRGQNHPNDKNYQCDRCGVWLRKDELG